MDVNLATTSNLASKKDSLSSLMDKQVSQAQEVLPDSGIPSAGDTERNVNKVNQASKVDSEELQKAVDDISKSMNVMQKGLAFNVDEDSGMQVVKVIDVKTGDLIRQIPNEEALDIAKKLNEVAGLLMKTEV
ncbi:flagellar protein FlaG [Shewanella sp. SR44-3]|uniref:flagellar protein FlaG n=1 Tax=unclassified Shewanella TaxID=196818 RepID=UPI002175C165|nr:flagellar protein FlaG [Shewanella sp. SR44-3]